MERVEDEDEVEDLDETKPLGLQGKSSFRWILQCKVDDSSTKLKLCTKEALTERDGKSAIKDYVQGQKGDLDKKIRNFKRKIADSESEYTL